MRSVFYPQLLNGPFGDPALYVRVAHRGEALLFDCGDLHSLTAREALKIQAVFISHAHIDHIIGFDALLRFFLYQDRHLFIYGPPGLCEQIGGRLRGYTWNLVEDFSLVLTVREWGEGQGRQVRYRAVRGFVPEPLPDYPCPAGVLHQGVAYGVRAVPLDHGGIASLAFVLEEPLHVAIHKDALERHGYCPGPWLSRLKDLLRTEGGETATIGVPLEDGGTLPLPAAEAARRVAHTERGMKVAYVTDAAPSPENQERIRTLASGAHLLAIEAVFAEEERERARLRSHLTAALAGTLARQARCARLLVFHHSPRYQDDPKRLQREAQWAFSGGGEEA